MRPFVNWAKALGKKSMLIFYKCPDLLKGFEDFAPLRSGTVSTDNLEELASILKRNSVNYVMSDDYAPRMELLLKLAPSLNLRKGVYVQLLYGMHALMRNFNKSALDFNSKLAFSLIPFIPFKLLSKRYCNFLKGSDILIANSRFTASILRYLYGVEISAVLYPPVDEMIFQTHANDRTVNEVVLYCGSNAADTDPWLLRQLLESLVNSDCVNKINLIGNEAVHCLAGKSISHPMVNPIHDVSDIELAKVYSNSILTICPQEWETFGYVPIESILCGTPVLAFASQPFGELVQDKDIAHLVYSRKMLLERLKELPADMDRLLLMRRKCIQHRQDLLKDVSQTQSADKLLSVFSRRTFE